MQSPLLLHGRMNRAQTPGGARGRSPRQSFDGLAREG
jgi:hypothetical protein